MKQLLANAGIMALGLLSATTFMLFVILTVFLISTLVSLPFAYFFNATPPGAYEFVQTPPEAGFLKGLIHGILFPFSFGYSLFFDSVTIYDLDNNGFGYNLGFAIGISILSLRK